MGSVDVTIRDLAGGEVGARNLAPGGRLAWQFQRRQGRSRRSFSAALLDKNPDRLSSRRQGLGSRHGGAESNPIPSNIAGCSWRGPHDFSPQTHGIGAVAQTQLCTGGPQRQRNDGKTQAAAEGRYVATTEKADGHQIELVIGNAGAHILLEE